MGQLFTVISEAPLPNEIPNDVINLNITCLKKNPSPQSKQKNIDYNNLSAQDKATFDAFTTMIKNLVNNP